MKTSMYNLDQKILDQLAAAGNKAVNAQGLQGIAHRGYSATVPENTLPAYTVAKEKGFRFVECDVEWTADNVPVLLHDATIDRTSDGEGDVSSFTFDQLQVFDFGGWKHNDYIGTTIPSFEEFIIHCKVLRLHPYIETKGNIDATKASILVDIVKRYGMLDNVSWISFSYSSLQEIQKLDKTARLGYLCALDANTIAQTVALRNDVNEVFINVSHISVTKELMEIARNNELSVEVWTVNTSLDAYRLAKLGVDGITTDVLLIDQIMTLKEKTLAYWKLDETGTTLLDSSGNGFNAEVKGGVTSVPGLAKGNAVKGDGTTGYLQTQFKMAGLTNFKVSMYFKLNSFPVRDVGWGWSSLLSNYRTVDAVNCGFYISVRHAMPATETREALPTTLITKLLTASGQILELPSDHEPKLGVTYKIISEYNGSQLIFKMYEMVGDTAVLVSETSGAITGVMNTNMAGLTLLTENALKHIEYADAVIDEVKITTMV